MKDLIFWDKEKIHEPLFTCNLCKSEIMNIINVPFNAEHFPLHTQSTERAVKLVTEASANVCGQERREGFIQTRIESRKAIPSYDVKKNLFKVFHV